MLKPFIFIYYAKRCQSVLLSYQFNPVRVNNNKLIFLDVVLRSLSTMDAFIIQLQFTVFHHFCVVARLRSCCFGTNQTKTCETGKIANCMRRTQCTQYTTFLFYSTVREPCTTNDWLLWIVEQWKQDEIDEIATNWNVQIIINRLIDV